MANNMTYDWSRPRAELDALGSTVILRGLRGVGIRRAVNVWYPGKHIVLRVLSSFGRPVTVWPIHDSDGPSFVAVVGVGKDAADGLSEFLNGFRESYPDVEVTGEPFIAGAGG